MVGYTAQTKKSSKALHSEKKITFAGANGFRIGWFASPGIKRESGENPVQFPLLYVFHAST